MPRYPHVKKGGNAVWLPEGLPDCLKYEELNRTTVERLKACEVPGYDDAWDYARFHMHRVTGLPKSPKDDEAEATKEARFAWIRKHFPPREVASIYKNMKSAEAVNAEVPSGPEGVGEPADCGIAETPPDAPCEEVPEVAEVCETLGVVAENPPSAVSSGGESKIKVEGFKPSAPLDNSMDIDRSVPGDWTLERFLSVALWTTQNAQHVLTGRVKLRHCPWPEAWFFVEVALSNPAQFLSRVAEKVIEYDRQKSAESKAERGKLVDDGGKLSLLLKRLEKAEPVA